MARMYLRYGTSCFYLATKLLLFFTRHPDKPAPKSLLILKPDSIGDYIMMRNFLALLRRSEKFRDYRITFCGNAVYREFAGIFDKDAADEFIWIDKNRIYRDVFYYLRTVSHLNGRYSVVIHPVGSREFIFDTLVKVAGCRERIGLASDTVNIIRFFRSISDKWYTHLIEIDPSVRFEFFRMRLFFENVLEMPLKIERPFVDNGQTSLHSSLSLERPYAIIFPGAQLFFRRWPVMKFAKVCDHLYNEYKLKVFIAGSRQDHELAEKIMMNSKTSPVNITGKTGLSELPALIREADLMIANDSAAAHIAPMVNTPSIVLSQMNHYMRFVPYPKELKVCQICVIPEIHKTVNEEQLAEDYREGSDVNIDLITTKQVTEAIASLLH